ncbi:MAG: hypothetical protein QOG03_1634, partial [Actinomycetota bacterium]|nr:hypothetical protein [Actinomycetota bacterium]
ARVAIAWLAVAQAVALVQLVARRGDEGGYTSPRWQRAAPGLADRLRPYGTLASNRPEAVWMLSGRSATRLPSAGDGAQLAALKDALDRGGAIVVLPNLGLGPRTYLIDGREAAHRLGYRVVWRYQQVRVYAPKPKARPKRSCPAAQPGPGRARSRPCDAGRAGRSSTR